MPVAVPTRTTRQLRKPVLDGLSCYLKDHTVLLAYLDEFGHGGPFVDSDHKRFHHHPVFGYAGFVIPAHNVRVFGGKFAAQKKRMFRSEVFAAGKNINQWEKKGG